MLKVKNAKSEITLRHPPGNATEVYLHRLHAGIRESKNVESHVPTITPTIHDS